MPASIIVNQATKPAGVAGTARDDLDLGLLVTCTNSTVESSYLWTVEDSPIRSALVRGSTGTTASFTFTPDVAGTYRVSLRVNGSVLASDYAVTFGGVVTTGAKSLGWRYPSAGEELLEDNIAKPGLGFPSDINPRGWATDNDLQREQIEAATYDVLNAVTVSPGTGSDALVRLDTLTGELDPSVIPGGTGNAIVVREDGAALTTAVTEIDFVGDGVTASAVGSLVTVNIPGSYDVEHFNISGVISGISTPSGILDGLRTIGRPTTISSVVVTQGVDGTSGTTTVELYKVDVSDVATQITTTNSASLPFGGGSNARAVSTSFNLGTNTLVPTDRLGILLTSVQGGTAETLTVTVIIAGPGLSPPPDPSIITDDDFAGTTTGVMKRTGVGTYAVRLDNLAAGIAPTVNDDSSAGYEVGSRWIVTGTDEYVCLDASVGAAVWTSSATTTAVTNSDVLWEWNRTDTTQFDTANPIVHQRDLGGTAGSVTMTFVADVWQGEPGLRIAGSIQGGHIVPVLTSELVLPERYVVEVRIARISVSTNPGLCALFFNDTAGVVNGLYLSRSTGSSAASFSGVKADLQTVGVTAGTGAAWNATAEAHGGGVYSLEVWRQAGSNPTKMAVRNTIMESTVHGRGAVNETTSTFSPTWDGIDMTRFGLGMYCGSAASAGEVDFMDLRILRHPLDR